LTKGHHKVIIEKVIQACFPKTQNLGMQIKSAIRGKLLAKLKFKKKYFLPKI